MYSKAHLSDSCGREADCTEETHAEELVKHQFTYMNDILEGLFSPWKAVGVKPKERKWQLGPGYSDFKVVTED